MSKAKSGVNTLLRSKAMNNTAIHPLGTKAKVLLSSVFGPYAVDDEYGSRKNNPMELYHNQVTRVQGSFSLRMFHRSFGLMMIQHNIDAPATLLDFPDLKRFTNEISKNEYDIVGISSIVPNIGKVTKMCKLIRKHLPKAKIVVGGHVANVDEINKRIDADHIVKGEGISWFRKYLGQDDKAPVKHPHMSSAYGTRIVGVDLNEKKGEVAAMLVPSVGCPLGCNFCCTSSHFGGKGKFFNFFDTGDELFQIMCEMERDLKTKSFFVMDENFLLHKKRALRLLDLMKENEKSWSLLVFSSAKVLKSYTLEQLVGLGLAWVWMGLEGEESSYTKLKGIDTFELINELQENGIRVLGSSIIGLENHTESIIENVIDYAVAHNSVFHQFMLYTPLPGTPLYKEHKALNTLVSEKELPLADIHGQYKFNYKHPNIKNGREEQLLLNAFNRDFKINGPSLFRIIKVLLNGWKKYKNHPEKRIREHVAREVKPLKTTYAGALWAMIKWFKNDKELSGKMNKVLEDIYEEFGWFTKKITPTIGKFVYIKIFLEERRLQKGWTYEPKVFYEKNEAALRLEKTLLSYIKPYKFKRIKKAEPVLDLN